MEHNSRGVIYLNVGTPCIPRLLVSLHSLRKHYEGPVTVLSQGEISHQIFRQTPHLCELKEIDDLTVPPGPQPIFLKKTLVHTVTPYETSVFIDADTLVRGPIYGLFDLAEISQFVATRFAKWTTTKKKLIQKRIRSWEPYHPHLIETALQFGPAINAGVYAFTKGAEFLKHWYRLTFPGRHLFLPEETAMQIAIHQYPHFVADQKFNCSCKHSKPHDPDIRIIHYHGRKHCDVRYGGDLWLKELEEVWEENPANIRFWATSYDKELRKHRGNKHDSD